MAAVDGTSSPAVSVDSTVDSSLKRIKLEIADLRAQNAILNRNLEKQREIDGKKCKMYDERVDYLKCHLAKQGNVLFHAQKEIARLNKAMSQMTKKAVDQSEDSADGIADEEDDGELSEIDVVMESESQAENKPATDEPVFATSKCIKTYSTRQKDRPVHTGSDPGTSVKIPRKAVAPGRKRNYPEISGAGLHTRKRNGEKRFRCPVAFCGRSYFQSCTLQRHIRVNHHGARPFSCEFAFCSRRYSCRSELQRHIKSHSGDRPFKCDYGSCWRRFATGGELERHKRVHDRYKLFKCPWENCGQKFLQRFRFAEHMSRHTGEQRFQCPVKGCSKRFLEDRLLHIHQAAHFRDLYPISDAGEGDNGVFEDIPPQSMCEAQIKTEPEDYDEEMGSDTEAEANLLGRVFNLPDAGRSNPQETSIGVETEDRDDGDGEEANPGIERVPRIKVEPEEYEEPESDDGRDMESSGDVFNCLGGIGGKVYREESQRTGAETLEVEPAHPEPESMSGPSVKVNLPTNNLTYSLVRKNGRLVHTYAIRKPFQCHFEDCTEGFTDEPSLEQHTRLHIEKGFVCRVKGCKLGFSNSGELKSHAQIHIGKKHFACSFEGCERSFATKYQLRWHTCTHTGEKPFECKFEGCAKRFVHRYELRLHMRKHTGDQLIKCGDCGKGFVRKCGLLKHMQVHSGERPFVCGFEGCFRRFKRQRQMLTHELTHID